MAHWAIFISGPVGVGKTTLGRAVAGRLSAGFIDGDDLVEPDRPWFCSSLQTSRRIVQDGLATLESRPVVVVAYPLRCISWIYFRRTFIAEGVTPLFVTLRASFESIVAPNRGRQFSRDERARIAVMLREGYDRRPFSTVVLDTDKADYPGTLARLEHEVRCLMLT